MIYNFYSTSLIFLAGFCLFYVFYHFTTQQLRQQRRVHLLFAGITLSLIGTILTGVISFNTSAIADHITWVRTNVIFNIVMYALLPWFFAVHSGVRPKLVLAGSAALCMLLFFINLTQPNTLLYSEIHGIDRLLLPWGEEVFFIKATPSIWGTISFGYVLFVPIFGLYALIRRYRFDRRRSTLIMIFAVAVLTAALTQNVLVKIAGIHNLPPLGSFGFLIMVIIMGMTLTRELREDRKRAEEELRKSKDLLLEMTTQVPGVVYQFYARPNGEMGFYYVSARSDQILGIKPNLEGYFERVAALVIPEHREGFIKSIEKAVKEFSEWKYEGMLQKPSGELIWFSGNSTPSPRESEVVFNGIVSDITDRKQMELALRQSESRLKSILSSMNDIIFEIDLNGCFKGYFAPNNKSLYAQPDLFIGKKFDEVLPEDVCVLLRQAIESINSGNPYQQFEYHLTIDNTIQWEHAVVTPRYNTSDEIVGVTAVCRNITDHKQIEEALQQSEKKYREIVENAPIGIYRRELEGKFQYVNPALILQLECKTEKELLDNYGLISQRWVCPERSDEFNAVLLENRRVYGYETETRLVDGTTKWFALYSFLDDSDQFINGFSVDITALKRAEGTLRSFKDLVQHSSDAIGMSAPDGRHYYQNEVFDRLFGDVGEHPSDTLYVDKAIGQQVFDTIMGGRIWQGEVKMFKSDRTILNILLRAYAIQEQDGRITGLVGLHTDITDHKRLEEESNRLAAVVRHSRELVNLSTPDGTMVFLNDAGKKMLGIPEEDIAQSNIMQVIPEHLQEKVRQELLPALLGEGFWEGDLQYRNLETGRLTDVHAITFRITDPETGALQFLANVSLDITARKKVEEALHKSEVRYRTLFEDATDGMALADTDTGELIDCNLGLCQMVERDKAELVGQMQSIIHHPVAIIERFSKTFQQHQNGDHMLSLEDHLLSKSGKLIPVEVRAARIEINGRDCLLGIFRDITERERAEQELRISREQLIKADKMIALGTLVAGVAHEINNPNNFIMLNTPLIQEVWKGVLPVLEEYYREHGDFKTGGMSYSNVREGVPILFNGILEGARRISGIVKELKDFARPDDINMNQKVDINAAVKAAVNLLQNVISKATDLFSVTYGNNIPELTGNFQRIEQVVINLIHNACQALPDKTSSIAVVTSCDSHSINVRIRDEGKGIAQEHLNQIMDPFFTTRQGSGGMGLGLSISQKIIFEHGGRIDVESAEGKGSTFTIILPLMPLEKGEL